MDDMEFEMQRIYFRHFDKSKITQSNKLRKSKWLQDILTLDISTPDFAIMNLSTPDINVL